MAVLVGANPGVSPTRLQIGQWLVVPRAPGPDDARRPVTAESAVAARSTDATHVVRRGDTLWDLARRYGVGVSELRSWNGLADDAVLQPGDRLVVRGCVTTARTC